MQPATGPERSEARFERTLTVDGAVAMDVSMRSGLVRVRRGDDGVVTIRGIVRAQPSIFSWIHPEEQVQVLAANPPIHQNGNTIQIGDAADRWLLRRVHFLVDIAAPANTCMRALSDSADIRIEGINGPLDCESDSGEIQITGARAQVSALTDSGSIRIRDAADSVDVQSDSGEIEALEISAGIDAQTDSGNIRVSQTVAAPIYARSDSGRIRLKLASGGYTIRVRTDHGAIEIPDLAERRASRGETEGVIRGGGSIVAIETDSGDIEIV
jgi:hypothetical protein